jgi:hypothetical protein
VDKKSNQIKLKYAVFACNAAENNDIINLTLWKYFISFLRGALQMTFFTDLVDKLSRDTESERQRAACRNLATGLLIGACVGVTAGIIFAPKSGRETRKEIADKTADAVDHLRETVAEYVSEVQARLEEVDNLTDGEA